MCSSKSVIMDININKKTSMNKRKWPFMDGWREGMRKGGGESILDLSETQ